LILEQPEEIRAVNFLEIITAAAQGIGNVSNYSFSTA
jgi:hypothetical protein